MSSAADPYPRRFAAQMLVGKPARDPAAVAERLLAVQAQEMRAALLTIRARSKGLGASDLGRALEQRRLVVGWVNRGTLHLVRSEDWHWLHALTAPRQKTTINRRLEQEGVTQAALERAIKAIEKALADRGPLVRDELGARVAAAKVRTEGQALVTILAAASLRGLIVRGPMQGATQAFALTRDWLAEPPRFDREAALAELARRYLAGHEPADARDLAKWAGITLGDSRRGFGAIADELRERPDGLLELRGRKPAARVPAPRLLGPFEPLLLGWSSREAVVGEHAGLVTSNGVIKPFALVDGRAVATWTMPGGRVDLEPLAKISAAAEKALAGEAAAVERYMAA